MSFSTENGGSPFTMPVAPYGGYGNNGGLFGGDGAWWLIILLLFANNGWGNGFGGFGGGGMLPFMMGNQQNNDVQRGFDQSAIMSGINGINNGLAAAEVSRCNGQTNILQTLNANQGALMQSMNTLAGGLQNCCCENRAGLADLKYAVATENCADRAAVNDMGVNLIMAGNNNTQRLVDTINAKVDGVMGKICQLELDGKNAQIAELQAQLNDANRRAESRDEIAQILASQAAQTSALEQYLAPTPRPAWIVQNPNCCTQNFGCGCAG